MGLRGLLITGLVAILFKLAQQPVITARIQAQTARLAA
jgi:hypothetical protein